MRRILLLTVSAVLVAPRMAPACSSILVSRGATVDGSSLITYAADSHELYGDLVMRPASENLPGAMLEVFEWDTGKYLGEIVQAPRTYAVVGHMNERQVAIGESTFGGREELVDPTGVVDYGSLMYLALARAGTAREAIKVMTDLVAEYGYASSGESFSISDPREAWILEMIGKGPGRKGAVWVARKVPDGMISAHANHSRIRQFPLKDADTLYAKDVIAFAREKGYFKGKDADFSFADAYAPLDYGALRFCEARVWSVFRRAAPSQNLQSDYVRGVENAKPLPLWVKPDRKLGVHDVMELMRDHFEGTELDMTKDVGAGPFALPYRWRPMTWKVDGVEYLHERAISTQQTGFSFVAQSRAAMPDPIGGVLWFGVDDTYSTVYVPLYAGLREVPRAFAPGVATLHQLSWDSAFWVFNAVSNFAYSRYSDMIRDVRRAQAELEGDFLARQPGIEAAALKLYASSPELARDYLTDYSRRQTERTMTRWRRLGEELLVEYLDGNVKDEKGAVTHPKYPESWYRAIVKDAGERLKTRKVGTEPPGEKPLAVAGYFHSRAELGELASAVPADFPFASEKLVLLPGSSRCEAKPRCCLKPEVKGGKLFVREPEEAPSACGAPGWLVRIPKEESRAIVQAAAEH